ncbi:MAG: hypothetical protein K0S14_1438 [Thermomicrobiales bacterium]|nr:hypothetical protein [Thermomicrobiales bacterium]
MHRHQDRHAELSQCLGNQSFLTGAYRRRRSGHDCPFRRHQHEIAHEHRVRFVDASSVDVMDDDPGRPIGLGERVMLLPHAVRRKIRSHLHGVEVGDCIKLGTGPAQQHGVQPSDLRGDAPVAPGGRHVLGHRRQARRPQLPAVGRRQDRRAHDANSRCRINRPPTWWTGPRAPWPRLPVGWEC